MTIGLAVAANLILLLAASMLGRHRWRQWRHARAATRAERKVRHRRRRALAVVLVITGWMIVLPNTTAYALSDCKDAPGVETPADGLVARIDSHVGDLDSNNQPTQGQPGTPYGDYGYAGMTWQTYDLGCGGDSRAPVAAGETAVSNWVFDVAKLEVATFNGVHYALANPASFNWLDDFVNNISADMFQGVFAKWVGLVLTVLAIILLGYAGRADLAGLSRRAAWAIIALTFASTTAITPLVWEQFVRGTVVDLSNDASSGFFKDARSADALPDYFTNGIIYPQWQVGEFGHTDNDAAKRYSMQLLAAKACSKTEMRTGCDTKAKQSDFKKVAGQIGDLDGTYAYQTLKGDGDARPSAAATAVASVSAAGIFQVVALIVLLFSILIVAFMVILGPLLGLLAVLNPETMRGVFRALGAALVNTIVMGIMAGIHARLVLWITGANIGFLLTETSILLISILMLMLAQPIRRMRTMLRAVMETVGGTMTASDMLGRSQYRDHRPSDQYLLDQRAQPDDTPSDPKPDESNPTKPTVPEQFTNPDESSSPVSLTKGLGDPGFGGSSTLGTPGSAGFAGALGAGSGGGAGTGAAAAGGSAAGIAQASPHARIALAGAELVGALSKELGPAAPEAEQPSVTEHMPNMRPGESIATPGGSSGRQPVDDWYRPDAGDSAQGLSAAPTHSGPDGETIHSLTSRTPLATTEPLYLPDPSHEADQTAQVGQVPEADHGPI